MDTCDAMGGGIFMCRVNETDSSGAGLQHGASVYPAQDGDTVYLLYSKAQSVVGTPFSPMTNSTVTAQMGLPLADTEYLLRVRSANLNEGGFELVGSNLATVLTVGRPEIVSDLNILYMSGDKAVQLVWKERHGGTICGDVVYRLFRQPFVDYFNAYSTPWRVTHAGYLREAPSGEGILVNLSVWNLNMTKEYANETVRQAVAAAEAAATSTKARFVVCSYCQAHLPGLAPNAHTLPFIEDALGGVADERENAPIDPWCVLGNILPVQSRPRPKDPVTDVRIVGMGESVIRLTWAPVLHADRYKVLVSHRTPSNGTHSCSKSSNTSWGAWEAYQFPLMDYPGKGAGEV